MSTAEAAQKAWVALTVDARRDMLLKLADMVEAEVDTFTKLNVEDYAPPISLSPAHPRQLIRYLRYYAGYVDKGHGQISPASTTHDINMIEREARGSKTGKLLTGGRRLDELDKGYFLAPTLFGDVSNTSDLARIETFGPVASIMRFTTEDEAVTIANDTDFGLAAFVQTTNLNRAHRVARQLQAGSVYVNSNCDITPQNPYGGYKQSGVGRCGGIEGLHEFQQVKNIRLGMD